MKANELRLGNWVKGSFLGELCKVTQLGHEKYHEYVGAEGIGFYGQNGFEPIPLTPEILVKAGFENKSSTTDYIFEYGQFIIGGTRKRLFPSVWGEDGLQDYGDLIEYVHQLQNLYFALTGKELTFDL
jgi:hypothetical protein